MDPARFRRIEELYHAAWEREPGEREPGEREPGERDSFLKETCHSDPELRRELEALLAQDRLTDGLVDRTAWADAGILRAATRSWSQAKS